MGIHGHDKPSVMMISSCAVVNTFLCLMQVFPVELLHNTYRDPKNPRHRLARTEVQRRCEYIKLLHQQLGEQHPLVLLVEQCLDDEPSERPSAQELLQQLEGMRAQTENPYQHLTKLEAMITLKEKDAALREKDAVLREKDTEIGDLHPQVKVSYQSTADHELYSNAH